MVGHLSEKQTNSYLTNALSGDELLTVSDHLAECTECSSALASSQESLLLDPVPNKPFHLSYATLEAVANETADPVALEVTELHFSECASCLDLFNDLRILRQELSAEAVREQFVISKEVPATTTNGIRGGFNLSRYLVPAFGLILLTMAGVWLWWSNSGSNQAVEIATVSNDSPPPSSLVVDEPTPAPEPAATETRRILVSLKDGGGTIEIDDTGRISGSVSPSFDDRIRKALMQQQIAISPDSRALGQGSGVLMNGGKADIPFALKSPVGVVIESQRPRFSWNPTQDAQSYTVEVFDDSFNPIAASSSLTVTTWIPDDPLPRGRTYAWQVTAKIGEKEVRSPLRPAPDARFKIIDAAKSQDITEAKRTGSKLMLAMAYAEAGMLSDAERELSALVRANPKSDIARALLAKVKAAR